MPIKIQQNLIEQYVDYFKDPERFRIPSRDPDQFNVSDDFFGNLYHARQSLELLLHGVLLFPEPTDKLEQGIYTEFTITGHAKVREAPGQDSKVKILVGQSDLMLERGARGTDKAIEQHKNSDSGSLVISSDTGRAMHHSLLKYYPEMRDKLDEYADDIEKEFKDNNGLTSRGTHINLVRLVLDNGIIPTPLLRSHYHGIRDLNPEIWGQFDINAFIRTELCRNLYQGKSEEEIREILTTLKDFAKHGRDPFQSVEDFKGKTLTENLPLYAHRLAYLLKIFSPPRGEFYDSVRGKKINLIGHSSNIDIVSAYFRHFGDESRVILEKADKSKTRGKEVIVKVDSNFIYLNDPKKIEAIQTLSAETISEQRKASLDEKIREPKEGEDAIIPVELLRFERKQDQTERITYEPHPISIDGVLASPEPALWLGNFGQGKSTAAIELTERLNSDCRYVAVLITARDINRSLHNALGDNPKDNDRIILDLLSRGVASLPKILQDEYKFVFIIDALDEISNYRKNIIHIAKDSGQLKEYGKVIVTSRFTGLDQYENPGFTTLHLDPQALIGNIDQYLALRITDASKREKFKEFLMQQDEGIKTNYLLVYFLTDIYNKRPQELGDLKGTVSEGELLIKGIEIALWDHKLTKDPNMPQMPRPYEGQPLEEAEATKQRYEAIRGSQLDVWMGLLQRVASYMTVHDKRIITRPEIEQLLSSNWTLAKYASQLKGR